MTAQPSDPDVATEPAQSPRTSLEWMAAAAAAGIDPTPTPITLRTLPGLLERTWRTERINHGTLGRRRSFRPRRVAASVMPALRRPIFIVGAARSGTTFLGDAVGQLPEVSYHHEPVATKAAGRYVYDGSWGYRRSRMFFRTVYAWLLRYQVDGGLRLAEKTPTNAFLVSFLARAFPDAQFVHLIRDGRDVAASHIQKPWLRADSALLGRREPGGYPYGPWAPWWVDAAERTEYETGSDELRVSMAWRRYVQAAMDGGAQVGRERYLEVRYESLVRDPRSVGNALLDYLGIDQAGSRATFLASLDTASSGSVGSWQAAFTREQMAVLEADAGPLLRRLGYGSGG
jgi:hypothetical protein